MPLNLEHVDVHIGELRLHTVQCGPQDGRRLILLHGFPEFWYGWKAQIPYFAGRGWRVVVPDQRGYNLSGRPRAVDAYAVERLAADVSELIRVLGWERVCLAGHDWGAAVAWETALRYPERLERLAVLNVPHPDVMSRFVRTDREQQRRSWYIFFFQLPWIPEWLLRRSRCAGLRRLLQRSSAPGTFQPADLDRYVEAWSRPGALTAMLAWYRAAVRSALRARLNPASLPARRVHVPALILWGMNDVALTARMIDPSLALCDDGQAVRFAGVSHWVQHEAAAGVNAALEAFFARENVAKS